MTDERTFLHQIANTLATLKISVELLQEMEEGSSDPDKAKLWERATTALRQLQTEIGNRQNDVRGAK